AGGRGGQNGVKEGGGGNALLPPLRVRLTGLVLPATGCWRRNLAGRSRNWLRYMPGRWSQGTALVLVVRAAARGPVWRPSHGSRRRRRNGLEMSHRRSRYPLVDNLPTNWCRRLG